MLVDKTEFFPQVSLFFDFNNNTVESSYILVDTDSSLNISIVESLLCKPNCFNHHDKLSSMFSHLQSYSR